MNGYSILLLWFAEDDVKEILHKKMKQLFKTYFKMVGIDFGYSLVLIGMGNNTQMKEFHTFE